MNKEISQIKHVCLQCSGVFDDDDEFYNHVCEKVEPITVFCEKCEEFMESEEFENHNCL